MALVLLISSTSYSQCVWTEVDFEGFEYATACPDLIPGTTYHPNPSTYASGQHTGNTYMYMNFVTGLPSGSLVYERFYNVCPGQQYRTSSWYIGLNNSTSNITLRIVDANGLVLDTWSGSSVVGVYSNHISNIVIPTTTTISFQLISDGAPGNNDMGFDDLSLSSCINSSEDEGTISICQSATPINLHDSLSTIVGTGGTWTGPSALSNGFQGTFDPAINTNGIYTYTISNGINCVDSVAFFNLSLASAPSLTTNNVVTCLSSGANITNSYIDNNATGGTVTYWQDPLATITEPNPTNITAAGTYYIVMDAGGCTDTASVNVSFSSLQTIDLGPDTLLCHNQSLTLDAGAGFDYYLWSNDSTTQTITTDTAGIHWVQGFTTGNNLIVNGDFEAGNTGFTSDYIEATIIGPWGLLSNQGEYTITTSPDLAHNNFPACGDHTSGTGNMLVVNGANIANQNVWCQTIPVMPNSNYEFSAWVQNYFQLPANNPAQLSFFINGSQIGTTFSPTSAGCTWQNFFQLWNSGAATSANICITSQGLAAGGNDFALDDISFSPLCISSDTIVVSINPGPTTSIPNDSTFCAGETVPASAYTSTPLGGTFNWLNSNPAVGLAAASGTGNIISFTTTNATLQTDTSTISVWAELNNCPGDTAEYFIIVNPLPSTPTINDTLICTNNSVTLTPTAPGGTYEWFDAASGGNSLTIGSSYTTPVLTANDTFWVESTINNCTGLRKQVNVIIGAGLIVDAGLPVTICQGDTAFLNASPTTAGNTFAWTPSSSISDTSIFNPFATPLDTTIFKVKVTDIFGCIGIDSVKVNVKPTPIVTVPPNGIYCNGDIVPASNYTSTPAGAGYSWTNSNPSVGLLALSGSTANSTSNTPIFTATNTTTQPISSTISVTPTFFGCTGNPTDYTITVNSIPTLSPVSDATYCIDDIVPTSHFTGTPTGLTFDWTNTNTATGLNLTNGIGDIQSFTATNTSAIPQTSSITVTPYANGCTGPSITYNITVSERIILDRIITNAKCFDSSDGEISLIPSGGTAPFSYNWSNGDTDSIAGNLPAGNISVTVTDINNCTQDSIFFINQPDSIDYISFYATPTTGCSPLEVELTCTINPIDHLVQNYVWDFGNNLVPQDTFVGNTTYIDPGKYDVSLTITDYNGCSNTLTKKEYIEVYEDPEAHFEFTPEVPKMLNPTIDFIDLSFSNVVAWEWYFDTLANSYFQNPTYTFPEDSGTYLITLVVENENTCRDTVSRNIIIKSETAMFFPNSFTPNGDGTNDVFMPKGFGVELSSYSFMVFNRWGELVFKTNNISSGWDGTYNGQILPTGVYPWRIDYKDLNGNDYRKKGQVNILK
ncbi:MAG: gliding motility-associated C-terminal domain-containing protein [Vicingaceae bacterium]